jgi:hypothetical protein
MPPKKASPVLSPEERYPAIEEFIEFADASEVGELFRTVREGLEGVKGPRLGQGKRVKVALDRTEELLQLLLQTREKLMTSGKRRGS